MSTFYKPLSMEILIVLHYTLRIPLQVHSGASFPCGMQESNKRAFASWQVQVCLATGVLLKDRSFGLCMLASGRDKLQQQAVTDQPAWNKYYPVHVPVCHTNFMLMCTCRTGLSRSQHWSTEGTKLKSLLRKQVSNCRFLPLMCICAVILPLSEPAEPVFVEILPIVETVCGIKSSYSSLSLPKMANMCRL